MPPSKSTAPSLRQLYWQFLTWSRNYRRFLKFRLTHRGNRLGCTLCGWHGGAFVPYDNSTDILCPKCKSQPRHRFQKMVFDELGLPPRSARILHVAPKGELWMAKSLSSWYLSIDVDEGMAMRVMDLTRLDLPDGSVDFVCCNMVLEYIEDFDLALAEIYRVLAPGGIAALSSQLYPGKTERVEPVPEDHWHLWHPGTDDFFDHHLAAGFTIEFYRADDYAPSLRARHRLFGTEVVPICTKPV